MSAAITTVQEIRITDLRDIVVGEIYFDETNQIYYRDIQFLGDPFLGSTSQPTLMLKVVVSSQNRDEVQVTFPSGQY